MKIIFTCNGQAVREDVYVPGVMVPLAGDTVVIGGTEYNVEYRRWDYDYLTFEICVSKLDD